MTDRPWVGLSPVWVNTRFAKEALPPARTEAGPERCPVCGGADRSPFVRLRAGTDIALERSFCEDCGHVAFTRLPSQDWFTDFYRRSFETAATAPKAPPPIDYGAISDLLVPLLGRPDAKILDLGCGYGSAMDHFRQLGHANLVGLEISDRRADVSETLGVPVARTTAEAMLDDPVIRAQAPFDAVYSWHTFEHVVDPLASIRNAASVLEPGGALFICVPNAEAEHLIQMAHYVPHIHSYTEDSLARLMHEAGLDVVHVDDSLRVIGVKREPGSKPTPAEPPSVRLRRKFLRDFDLRDPSLHGEHDALVRWSDYRGSREVLEASYGSVTPLDRLDPASRIREAVAARRVSPVRRRFGPALRGRATVGQDGDPMLLEVTYRGAGAIGLGQVAVARLEAPSGAPLAYVYA